MRAITVRQPWAWAIIYAGKDVENRTRNIAGGYRGLLAIHAGLRDDDAGWASIDPDRYPIDPLKAVRSLLRFGGVRGAIIGVVDLVDMHHCKASQTADFAGQPVCFDDHTPIGQTCSPWAQGPDDCPGLYHLVLANPRPIEPIPATGHLGLWAVPDETADLIDLQLLRSAQ